MAGSIDPAAAPRGNVDLNIVPLIDLMSCLTAFLLVTAVWVTTAQLEVRPAGRGRPDKAPVVEPEVVSIQVETDRIWVGTARTGERLVLPRDGREWDGLGDAVRRVLAASATPPRVELAAASTAARPVRYDDLVHAMDAVIDGGAPDVRVADPHELTIRPTL